jgi:hypothetical protein
MGEAKRRKEAGDTSFKSGSEPMVNLFAIMHRPGGLEDLISMSAQIPKSSPISKDQLLEGICCNPWKGNENKISPYIIHYFSQTQSWKMTKLMPAEGFVINFHDYGNHYACREIMGMSKEQWTAYSDQWLRDRSTTHDFNFHKGV